MYLQVIWVAIKLFGSKVFDVELLRCTVGKVVSNPHHTNGGLRVSLVS
jgi:hypothetical protein